MSEAVQVVRDYNDVLAAHLRDPEMLREKLLPFVGPDTVCVEPASAPWGGTWIGIDGFMTMFTTGGEILNNLEFVESVGAPAPFDPVEDEYTAEGHIVMRRYTLDIPASTTTQALHMPCIERYEVIDGAIKHIEVFFFDAARLTALAGSSQA